MFSKILIVNRGEIAVRIIRTCKEMGIKTVAVYSEADADALHTQLADEAICIGPAKSADSYLNMQNILSAAFITKAAAIHPGFGFLAENATFAAMCKDCNIKFIGPDARTIELMGNKSNAKAMMEKAGISVIPGSKGPIKTLQEAYAWAKKIGYPVMIKASAGGGGRGIRKIYTKSALEKLFYEAKTEAKAAFGDDSMYMEKIIEKARHVEVQILADEFGNTLHLGERDCSMQRRNQKILEESPSTVVDEKTRLELGKMAVKAARAAKYKNAGTIEFLYDQDGNFYFMEMNTRIQVEHPVTEMATGIDIVKEQIKIAFGEKLEFTQKNVKITGHTIECRVNAENPRNNFIPSPGRIDYLLLPSGLNGLRVDTAIFPGYTIPPYYDSMIAKVITHGADRAEAIAKMKRALEEFVIRGVETNIDFQLELLENEDFINGNYYISFIEDRILTQHNKFQ